MECPNCGFDNLPGNDACEQCGASLTQEDLPAAEARSRVERSINEDAVQVLKPTAPVQVPEHTSLDEALRALREGGQGCVLVTDAEGRLVGIFTERDVLDRVVLEEGGQLPGIRELMSREPETLRPDQPLAYALGRMHLGDLRHLPLTDREGRPVGVVSSSDIINHLELVSRGTERRES